MSLIGRDGLGAAVVSLDTVRKDRKKGQKPYGIHQFHASIEDAWRCSYTNVRANMRIAVCAARASGVTRVTVRAAPSAA
jgi:hypothetical protein